MSLPSHLLVRAAVLSAGVVVLLAGCSGSSNPASHPTVTATVTSSPTGTTSPASPSSSAASSPAPSSSASGSSGPVLCTPTVTRFEVGQGEGAAGTTYFPIHVTNASQQPCVTTGYPGIALLDAGGRQIIQATRDPSTAPTTILLQPGQEATAVVAATDVGSGSAPCPTSPALLFTLPDNTDSTRIARTTPACAVRVRALVAGNGTG